MNGIHNTTGSLLGGIDHLRQSITDILTTPIGSRVMRRDYGSRLYELVDAPINSTMLIEIYAETADALARWEPRLRINRVLVESVMVGSLVMTIEAEYLPTGERIQLEGLQI